MGRAELEHDAPPSVGGERLDESGQVGDVVGHVMADHYVGCRGATGDFRPQPDHLRAGHAALGARGGEFGQCTRSLVDTDDRADVRYQRERGRSPTAPDVEHRPVRRESGQRETS